MTANPPKDKKAKNPYADTLNLPKTDFSMRANLPENEPKWVERWLKEDLYTKMRAKRQAAGADKFIVHLGPPYANGHMHMGHALTYVLKDFVVRAKFMAGFDSPYKPGWDCHGLPIEWKIEEKIRKQKKTKYDFSIKEIRDKCRAYANECITIQKQEWQRFGALGDWENPYKTMDYANEAGIVGELGKMARRGLVYKGLRSTQWSTVEETALAEAEVEYADKKSTAVYVAFKVDGREDDNIVIWTTTPWTLPANQAIAYAEDEDYIALTPEAVAEDSLVTVGQTYWVATKLQVDFIRAVGITEFATKDAKKGSEFAGWHAQHPFYDRRVPLLPAEHVTTDAGTGFVHTAPAHGQEDFSVGRAHNLSLHCPVLGNGVYDHTVEPLPLTGEMLEGVHIWKSQPLIIAEMEQSGALLHTYEITHSYPVSWRSKAPLIYRATPQWFIALDKPCEHLGGKTLREAALTAVHGAKKGDKHGLKKVNWEPAYGENRMGSMVANRPDWCISRQRCWGVPITIFLHKKTGEMITDKAVWAHIEGLIAKEGIDAWDTRIDENHVDELFPAGWLAKNGYKTADFEPMRDIMDVWIDSGTTHAHVLRANAGKGGDFERSDGKRPADLYQEGSDQHRGWFQSSLLTSVAVYGDAPYETVLTSGFVVDGEGRKFSKSLGNGVEPRQLLNQFGMDIIRLWVASSDYSEDIRYSDEIIRYSGDAYRRYRNTFRFLLGNLSGFDPVRDRVETADMPALEQYMRHRLYSVLAKIRTDMMQFKFHHAMRTVYDFCNADLSNFYFDIRKDILYCDEATSTRRKACQTVLFDILQGLTTHLAPIMPFTADEVWRTWFGEENSVHLEVFYEGDNAWQQPNIGEKWAKILATRTAINEIIERDLRAEGLVGSNIDVAVTLADDMGFPLADWADILVVSTVETGSKTSVAAAKTHKCPRCWKRISEVEDTLCGRCKSAI